MSGGMLRRLAKRRPPRMVNAAGRTIRLRRKERQNEGQRLRMKLTTKVREGEFGVGVCSRKTLGKTSTWF